MHNKITCPECKGTGWNPEIIGISSFGPVHNPCLFCGGSGTLPKPNWRDYLRELLYVYTCLQYVRTRESLERDFPKAKVQAMIRVYEELAGVSKVEVAQQLMDEMHIAGKVIEQNGDLFMEGAKH